MQEARRLLLADYEHRLKIRKLARKLGTNDFKLKKQFKAVFGVGIFECLQSERLEKAKELLASGEHTVTEIAYMTGYEHPRNFSSALKRSFGVRPGEVKGRN